MNGNVMTLHDFCKDEAKHITTEQRHTLQYQSSWVNLLENLKKGFIFMHGQGILNNDIKGDNVLILRDGQNNLMKPKIIDFNKASFISEEKCGKILLVDNIYVRFGGQLFGQMVGIPMQTNCAPLLADLFLYSYENEFLDKPIKEGKRKLARRVVYSG